VKEANCNPMVGYIFLKRFQDQGMKCEWNRHLFE
jgi:hypothetical protein